MNNKYIIALDIGSSSSRALAIDAQGKIIARSSRPVETLRPMEGQAEIDADVLWQGQRNMLEEIAAQIGLENIASLAITSQRSTVVFWDKLTGKPLSAALSWQDGRAEIPAAASQLDKEFIHRLTGLYVTPYYSAAKIHWALQHIQPVAQAAQAGRLCVGPLASYILWQLTGGKVFACDPTLAQRMLLFDIEKLDWSEELLDIFNVRREWLPQLKATCDKYGTWEKDGHSIPITVCVGDQQAALCALRVFNGEACINYGTGAFFMRNTGGKCHFLPGLLTSVAASVSNDNRCEYLLEGPLNACGTVFAWLGALGIEVKQEEIDVLCEQAVAPISFLPALGGLGAPYWDFQISPIMAGFSLHTTKADIVLGTVHALSYLMADIVFYAERCGISCQEIRVAGGLSQSRALLQSQADILQMSLIPCLESEGSALGAALLAAPSVGIDASGWNTLEILNKIQPKIDADCAEERYQRWHQFLNWCKSGK